jgi:hypothetical protein
MAILNGVRWGNRVLKGHVPNISKHPRKGVPDLGKELSDDSEFEIGIW